MQDCISGVVKFIRQYDQFSVAIFKKDDREKIKIIGNLYGVCEEDELKIWGDWSDHPDYGRQFKVNRWEKPVPSTKQQVEDLLASKIVKGIGRAGAQKIVEALGPDAIQIIMDQGVAALNIKGIRKSSREKIYRCICEAYEPQQVIMKLQELGIKAEVAIKAYKEFGSPAYEYVKNNPYCLIKLSQIGFKKADLRAREIGIKGDSPFRISAGILYVLNEAMSEGHCYLLYSELIEKTLSLLNGVEKCVTITQIKEILKQPFKEIVREGNYVYLTWLYIAEYNLAQRLKALAGRRENNSQTLLFRVRSLIKNYEKNHNLIFAPEQAMAIVKFIQKRFLILTGGPGTGKTETEKAAKVIYSEIYPDEDIFLVAPTGRAARQIGGKTIHKTLGIAPGKKCNYNQKSPLSCGMLNADEFSMVDLSLGYKLLNAISQNTAILIVGDPDQLPSVGPGAVLQDMINAGLPSVRLTEVHRTARDSQIVINAHRINKGLGIKTDPSKNDFFFIEKEKPEEIAQTIRASLVKFLRTGYSMMDIQILSPMKRGVIGTRELNTMFQELVNPSSPNRPEVRKGSMVFRIGDKVLQKKTVKRDDDTEICNGEVGIITNIITHSSEDGRQSVVVRVDFNGEEIDYNQSQIDELTLAYALTVHRSQGGEWPIVIMPVSTAHYIMLARNTLYTGLTRAKQKSILVGTKKALNIAIRNDKVARRNTRLAERLREADIICLEEFWKAV